MDKADGLGTGVAVAGHVMLFAVLSLGLAASIPPKAIPPPSMEVELIDEVALEATTPAPAEMQAAEAPEIGAPEEAAPQPAPVAEPLPTAPAPLPEPPMPVVRPTPQPLAKPVLRPAAKTIARAKPQPVVKPTPPKPVPKKPAPTKAATAKPSRAKPSASDTSTKTTDKKPATAASGEGEKTESRGSRLGKDFLAGLSDPSTGKAKTAGVVGAKAQADIYSAIKRQVDPCAKRQKFFGTGAHRITVRLNVKLTRNGSLAARPTVAGTTGVDDENARYEERVKDLAIAAFTGCSPLAGLPEEYYDAPRGWKNFIFRFKLPA